MDLNQIKLIIWDLDETFWKGTLSEGKITPIKRNIELIKKLSQRGIINSISSKNDFERTKQKLIELDIWQYFIFPIINWNPKGENIKDIINNCQLRASNVLFIDDNVTNLREAEYFNKGLMTSLPENINLLIEKANVIGKEDINLSRLKQYKILEEKLSFKEKISDNIEFLRQSNIRLTLIRNCEEYIDRIAELIQRTNQLNYTKQRDDINYIKNLIEDNNVECACIKVTDRFGDYGIVGFYALNKTKNKLIHFLFSCRIMNLGIEEYIYNKLNCPQIDIVQPVSNTLKKMDINWILETNETISINNHEDYFNRQKLLFIGGCDLDQLCHYLDDSKYEYITDFNYPNSKGIPVHREHTTYLKECLSLSPTELEEISELPFGDKKMFDINLYKNNYDILVFSVLMNYTHEVYTRKDLGYKISYGGYMAPEELFHHLEFTKDEKESFLTKFEFNGLQTPDEFYQDLEWLLKKINKPIIFINGAEIENVNENEPYAYHRHKEMNKKLDLFIENHKDKCQLIDVRKYVKSRNDIRDTIRHYQRIIYVDLAEDLMNKLSKEKNSISKYKKFTIIVTFIRQDCKIKVKSILYRLKSILKKIFNS